MTDIEKIVFEAMTDFSEATTNGEKAACIRFIATRLVAADALVEALGALYAWEFEETGTLLASWKERFPNIAWTKREIKLAAQAALRKYREAVK